MPSESAPLLFSDTENLDLPDQVADFAGGLLADEPGEEEAPYSCQTILSVQGLGFRVIWWCVGMAVCTAHDTVNMRGVVIEARSKLIAFF